jgi:hypothetical protein
MPQSRSGRREQEILDPTGNSNPSVVQSVAPLCSIKVKSFDKLNSLRRFNMDPAEQSSLVNVKGLVEESTLSK